MRYRDLRSALATSAAICAVAIATPAMAQNKTFDVPAQSAATGLPQLATQADVQILVSADAVRGKSIRAIKGSMSVDQAVRRAAADAGLRVVSSDGRTYTLASATAAAADAADTYVANEIVVTAQKRVESIQKVPIAITALSQDDLNEQKIEGGPDIMRAVPNLTFSKSNFTGYNLSIRGVGTKSISATSDPGVSVSFNNVGLIQNRFFEQEFFDLERVEILRGPQGTLYGRNATGGVVNLIPAKPDLGGFEGNIKGEVGNYNSRRMTAMLNVPIATDVLGVRVAGSMTQRDGYDFNSTTTNRVNGRDLWSLRTTVAFEPEPWFRANLVWERFSENDNRSRTGKQLCHRDDGPTSIGNRDLSTGLNQTDGSAEIYAAQRSALFSQGCKPGSLYDEEAFGTPNGLSLPFILAPNALKEAGMIAGFYIDPAFPRSNFNSFRSILQERDPYGGLMQSRDLREIASVRDPIYRASADLLAFNLELDVTPTLTLFSQTAYNEDKTYSFQDYNRFNSVPIFTDTALLTRAQVQPSNPTGSGPSAYKNLAPGGIYCDPQIGCSDTIAGFDISSASSKQFSQEFRLQSSFDGPFNFSIGGNYTKFKTLSDYYVMFNIFSALSESGVFNNQYSAAAYQPGVCTLVNFIGSGSVPSDDPSSGCPYVDPNPLASINGNGHNYFRSKNPYRLSSHAAFGEAYWDISDTVKITAGLRYTDDRKSFTPVPSQLFLAPSVNAGGTVAAGYPEKPAIKQQWGEFTGRFGVDWQPELSFTDNTLLYAFLSRGYKGGGANPPSPGFATKEESIALALAGGASPFIVDFYEANNYLPVLSLTAVDYGPTFKPEFVNALEIGSKNTLLNGALTLNATAFYYDYKDYQVSQIKDRTAVNENFDAEVWGLEFETVFAPTRNLRFNANVGYLDTKIGKGQSSIDIMNRTQGNDDYVLVKPWLQLPSNCVVPVGVAEYWATSTGAGGPLANYWTLCGGLGGIVNGLFGSPAFDPVLNKNYDPNDYPELNGGAGLRADLSGNELPNSPHWTVNVGAEYTLDFDDEWSATIRGDGYFQGKSWARVYNFNPYDRLKSWTNFNLSLRVNGPENLTIEAYVKNLFNSTPITDAFLNSDDTGLTTNIFTLDPRIIGFSIAKKF